MGALIITHELCDAERTGLVDCVPGVSMDVAGFRRSAVSYVRPPLD